METYSNKKIQLIKEFSEFVSNDDLTNLANVVIISKEILKTNRFPIKEYKQWLKKQK